ncbi:hypothetical protein FJT64_018674 [Amphibalanus amphitrite]|uniref:Uncharacterized protein n=1 Tax=Amphibalanus amphitrite TaxID=1232801 RepID=A0A6A4WT11_AMPAM|nr:hypothetical protein FJT64_018674 [Amphibalanus amphitrite]
MVEDKTCHKGEFEDTSGIQKYELTEEQYNSKQGLTCLPFSARQPSQLTVDRFVLQNGLRRSTAHAHPELAAALP